MRNSLLALIIIVTATAGISAMTEPAPATAARATSTQTAPAQTTAAAPVTTQAPVQAAAPAPPALKVDKDHRLVRIDTDLGSITVQLDAERAPITVKNFLKYVKTGFYNHTSFYRVVPGFVIQAGDYTADYKPKSLGKPIDNEAGNGLSNTRGSIAMARYDEPHSATAAFYINLVDNSWKLDPRPDRWGYAVFGRVVEGLDVMDKIAAVPTDAVEPFDKDAPVKPVVITKVTLLPLPK